MSESIENLRLRWEDEPSPQLSLQLAEEYRRMDRRKDAVHVLSLALEDYPDHVAARVALGRYRFEMGEIEEARELLEQVVNDDPTHLVASKLLVGVYLEKGDKRQAKDRLDLYKLLNESDPEIESLEDRLSGRMPVWQAAPVILDIPRNGDPFEGLGLDRDGADYWQALGTDEVFPAFGKPAPVSLKTLEIPVVEKDAPGATVTLANLYLQQGHLDDAENVLLEVLDRDSSNAEAMAGMDEIRKQRSQELAAAEALGATSPPVAVGANSRKIEVLQNYLRRIRAASSQ